MKAGSEKKLFTPTMFLIMLCWLVYTCSYLGKLGYNANITQIKTAYGIEEDATVGSVSTFFFFAYGVGQVINGLFCTKYNLRYVVFGGLLVSGTMNLLVAVVGNFQVLKYLWLINGAALSVLWPCLIRFLAENLEEKDIRRAVLVMGTTVATGTICVYGLSAIFVAMGVYKMMFFVAGFLLPSISVIWFFANPKLSKMNRAAKESTQPEIAQTAQTEQIEKPAKSQQKSTGKLGALWWPIVILAVFSVFDNLIKDGLTTWMPAILKNDYNLPDEISMLLTIVLPILAMFGTLVVTNLHKKISDFVMLCCVLFFVSAICVGLVMISNSVYITLAAFGLVACLMAGVNNVVTGMAPLYWKEKISSGLLAGILNGFCYLGSTLSAYGLGLVRDLSGGWGAVFGLLFILCVVAVVIAAVYGTIHYCKSKKNVR